MPNFEERAVTGWLAELGFHDSQTEWPPPVRPIETAGDAPARLVAFGRALDDIPGDALADFSTAVRDGQARDLLRSVLCQLGAARLLGTLHWIAGRPVPDGHLVTAALVEGDDAESVALRAALTAATRRAILHRMFSPERIAALATACAADAGEEG